MAAPRTSTWQSANPKSGPGYLRKLLRGRPSSTDDDICLSDGGHFDNMGLYELGRCRCIIVRDDAADAGSIIYLQSHAPGQKARRCAWNTPSKTRHFRVEALLSSSL